MKLIKTITALVLVMILWVPQMTLGAKFTDVSEGTPSLRAVEVLNALEVLKGYEDWYYRPELHITRAEFTVALIRLLGMEDLAQGDIKNAFADTKGHWASSYIALAASMNTIGGYGDGSFYPESNVTYEQGIKMLVTALGYASISESRGGYPNGYIITASDLKLLKKLEVSSVDKDLTRSETAILLYNALEVQMAPENYEHNLTKKEPRTILKDYLKVTRVSGMIVSNPYTGIYGASKTSTGYIGIRIGNDTRLYLCGETDGRALLGYYVQAYVYVGDDEEETVIYAYKDTQNTEFTVNTKDIGDVTLELFEYYNENRVVRQKLRPDAVVIYNGVFLGLVLSDKVTAETLKPKSGSVRFLEGNDTQIVFITEHRSYVVSSVNKDTKSIYLMENVFGDRKISYDQLDRKPRLFITRDGGEISVETLEEGDILTVATDSHDMNQSVNIIVQADGNKVVGSVTMMNETEVWIDDKPYTRSDECMQNFTVGNEGTFFVNKYGEVFYFSKNNSSFEKCAYLIKVASEKTGVSGKTQLKLLCADGTSAVISCANMVNLDGNRLKSEEISNLLRNGELILYRQNEAGFINWIKTAVRNTKAEDAFSSDYNDDDFSLDKNCYLTYRNNTPGIFGDNLYIINEDTVVFDVSSADEEDYSVRTRSMFRDNATYNVQIYDADANKVAMFIVNKGETNGQARIPWNTPILLIEKLVHALDDKGETRLKVYGYSEGKKIELFALNTDVGEQKIDGEIGTLYKLVDLAPGSIIQYTTTAKGSIDYIRVLHQPGVYGLPEKSWYGAGINSELLTVYGYLYTKTNDSVTVSTDNENNKPYSIKGVNVYSYDIHKNIGMISSLDEIITSRTAGGGADRTFIRAYKGNIYDIVLYRE